MNVRIGYAKLVYQLYKGRRTEFAHQIGGYPVVRLCQAPFEGNHLSITAVTAVSWCPRCTCHHIGSLHVGCLVARREAVLHRQRIEERFDGGTYLAATACDHIVLEMHEIQSSGISFHGSCLRIHTHKSCTEERLIVSDGIHRCHHGINISMLSKDGHIGRGVERLAYLRVGST